MRFPPMPQEEQERIEDLLSLSLLDTPPEERFDHLIQLAREHLKVPVAFMSLVDVKRQWFKACLGLAISETSRDVSFCAYTILSNQTLVVPDTLNDPRFSNNPLVKGSPFIRFYAGVPLSGPRGRRIGSFCIVDFVPREMSEDELTKLRDLAGQAQQEVNRTVALNMMQS